VKAVLVGTTVNPALADQLAQDLGIQVVPIYSDSLSAANGPAPTYVDLMRYDVKAIVQALK
jgi:ABC-type Zn uptake system ZnuABC Zn-binding protein ZnuA